MAFQKATKKQARGRMALVGPSGSGKTYTGLRVAKKLAQGGKVAVIDSERGSASKYADEFEFDVCELTDYNPDNYVKAIHEAEKAGYAVIMIDSLSHAWEGKGGVLDMKDNAAKRSKSGNSFMAWRDVTPVHNEFVGAMIGSSCHIIATMRTKTEWLIEKDDNGKQKPVKIGTQPVQRAGLEYEFDVIVDLDHELNAIVDKTRCPALSQKVFKRAGEDDLGAIFLDWLTDGAPRMVGAAEKQRLQDAVGERMKELGVSFEEFAATCGKDSINELGYTASGDVPVEKLNDALNLIARWEPKPASDAA